MADWYPPAIVDHGNDAGPYSDTGEPKGLLHTTEGKTYAGARQAYVLNNSWPHATCSFEAGRFQIWQHNPISVAARALRNESGGIETNRDNVVQLEIVGTADRHNAGSWGPQYVENFPDAYLDGIAGWMRFVEANRGVPRRCTVAFKKYPESYGNNGIRLSGSAWDSYSGWLGHQHAPENSHGDPGLIDMVYLLDQGDDDMPLDDADVKKIWNFQITQVDSAKGDAPAQSHLKWANHLGGEVNEWMPKFWNEFGILKAKLDELEAKVDALAPPATPNP